MARPGAGSLAPNLGSLAPFDPQGARRELAWRQLEREALEQLVETTVCLTKNKREGFPPAVGIALATEWERQQPRNARCRNTLALLYQLAGNWPRALQCAEQAVRLDPRVWTAWTRLGDCHLALGNTSRGRECVERAVALLPEPDKRVDEGWEMRHWFMAGQDGAGWRGWAGLNARLLAGGDGWLLGPHLRPLVGRRQWEGEHFDGRLLLGEQLGYGDSMMVLRWIPEVRERVGALTLHVRPEMVSLLAAQWEGVDVRSMTEGPGDFDRCVLSFSLPTIFGVEHPGDVVRPPYLRPPAAFRPLPGAFRVGLRWAGDARNAFDFMRSIPLSEWAAVLDVPGVTFYSLQVGAGAEQLPPFAGRIHDLAPELTDWAQTAAAMAALDLIISVDTSCAHLAGALGRPVWVCLSALPEWRWGLEGTTTPWYGSARLFRQGRVGEWPALFSEMARVLQERVASTTVAAA
jgi:hypothetical protein